MSHTRIRKFNTSQVYRGQRFDNDFCNAVVADNIVFLRGQVGMDLETNESVGIGDPVAQAEQAMSNIEMLLGEAGARLGDICKLVVYVTDARYREPVYQVIGGWLRGVYPCSTGVVVSGLARREWVVEIDATAVIPRERMAVTQ
jgi:enamine deaminase RidA (YjgF/YER057c/UK114 family)